MGSITHFLVCSWVLLPLGEAFPDFSACVFPFIYGNKTYTTCTKDGSSTGWLWCATTRSYDKDHRWKHCYETEHGGNSNGKPCVFPFAYKRRKFYTCTDEHARPRMFWCATTSSYDKDRKWSYCADTVLTEKLSNDTNQEKALSEPLDPKSSPSFKDPRKNGWDEAKKQPK